MTNFEKLSAIQDPELPVEQERSPERPFFEEERKLLEEAGKEIDDAPAEKLKKPGFRALAAFLTFLAGSTAFADRALAERDAAHKVSDENAIEKNIGTIDLSLGDIDHTEEPPFDIQNIVQKLSLEKNVETNSEEVTAKTLDNSWRGGNMGKFYENLSPVKIKEIRSEYFHALWGSTSYLEFEKSVKSKNFSDDEKLAFLQMLGRDLSRSYNYDMLKEGNHVKILEEDMFRALRGQGAGGICGNISDFLATTAQNMGIKEVWLQSGLVGKESPSGYVWVGMIVPGPDGKEQIAFLDYGDLNLTGTLNLEDALAVQEQRNGNISTFFSYISAKDKVLIPVSSKAEKLMTRSTGMKGSEAMLEHNLSRGVVAPQEGLEATLSNQFSELKLSNNMLGIAYVHASNEHDPYQSVQGMDALRFSLHQHGENFGIENEVTMLSMDIKNSSGGLRQGVFVQREIINRIAMNFLNTHELNLTEYRQFIVSYGAAVEGAVRYIMNNKIAQTGVGGHGEGSLGVRVAYLNPSALQEVYVQVLDKFRAQLNDFQDEQLLVKSVLEEITAGGVVKVQKGTLNIEGRLADVGYGTKLQGKIGFSMGDTSIAATHARTHSDYSSLIPNAKTTSLEFGKRLPQGELVFFASKTKEKYAKTENTKHEASILLRIPL